MSPAGFLGTEVLPAGSGPVGTGGRGSSGAPSGQIEIGPDQVLAWDGLAPPRARLSREQKLALLADDEQAVSRREGAAWMEERGIDPARTGERRALRETAQLPTGHPQLAARPHLLSGEQKAALLRDFSAAVAQGQDRAQAWLAAKNLTRLRMTRWQTALLPSTQQQAPQPAVPGGPGESTAVLLDLVGGLAAGPAGSTVQPPPAAAGRVRGDGQAWAGYAEALKLVRDFSLGGDEQAVARVQLRRLSTRGDPVGRLAWGAHLEVVKAFPSLLALAVLRWPDPDRQDSRGLADARDTLGRQVLGALWRTVEAGTTDPGNVAEVARQVAMAVTTQAPGLPATPDRYSRVDRTLTAGVARAFIDQTLTAVRETPGADASAVGLVEGLHQETAHTMGAFRHSNSQEGPRRASWQLLLDGFVSRVEAAAGGQVWWNLRQRLLDDTGGAPAPALPENAQPLPENAQRGKAPAGASGQLPGVEQESPLARRIQRRNLPRRGTEQVGAQLAVTTWFDEGVVPWPGWLERPELVGAFPSVLALAVLRWPDPDRQDSRKLADAHDTLGRQVLGALWRTVEADTTDPGNVTEVARQVAMAVTTQAPGIPATPDRYTRVDRTLTAGVARAFVDQTLTAVREAARAAVADPRVVGPVEGRHRETARIMYSLRQPNSQDGRRRASWQTLLGEFVSEVEAAAGPRAWWHLRQLLFRDAGGVPAPALPENAQPPPENAQPLPENAGTGGIPPGTARDGRGKRPRDEGHQPGSRSSRVARQRE